MKITFFFYSILLGVLLYTPIYAQDAQKAVEYLERVSTPLGEQKKETWQYLKAITHDKGARKVEKKRIKLLNALRESRSNVSRMGAFGSDKSLQKAVLSYIDLSYKVLKEDYDKILDMEEIAEQSYDAMEAYLLAQELADEKLRKAWDTMEGAFQSFADSYNIELISEDPDKRSQKIMQANKLLHYYNDLYLVFFKSHKQEAYILDAMKNEDVNALEQNIGSLLQFSDEGLDKIKELEDYQGDGSLKAATDRALNYFKDAAEKHYPTIVDFYLKKDNFEKLNKVIESKNKKDLTKADIDNYNKAVKEFNEAVNSVNAVNDMLNKQRAKNLNQYNQEVSRFFNSHSG